MKTKKWLSCFLAICLMLSMTASLFLIVNAEEPDAWSVSQMPKVLPNNGEITRQNAWIDFSIDGVWGDEHEIDEDGFVTVAAASSGHATVQGNKNSSYSGTAQWRGASGFMFYVDASQGSNVNFNFTVQVALNRFNSSGKNQWIKFAPCGTDSVAYYYQNGAWKSFTASGTTGNYLESKAKISGWYFIPMSSLVYRGGGATLYNGDLATGKNLAEFMWYSSVPNILRPCITCAPNIRFNTIYFVYENTESATISSTGASYPTSSSPLFSGITNPGHAGTGTISVSDNSVTVGGMTNNSSSCRDDSVWMFGVNSTLLTKDADGIRFRVDTTALPKGESLQMRFKLLTSTKISAYADLLYGTGNDMTTMDGNNVQYFLRADNSVIYYYDTNGKPIALHTCADVASNKTGDLFEALPENYSGDIYIPFDSVWMYINAYNGTDVLIPFKEIIDKFPVVGLAIDHAIAGQTEEVSNDHTVVYSNFEVVSVYKETRISGASVTLADDLSLNFFAVYQIGATNCKMTLNGQEVTGTLESNGSYRYVCDGILPQLINDKVTAVLTAEVNGNIVTQTMNYSVVDYCMETLADSSASEELKTLLVDLLYYGAEAQVYANYRTDALATERLNAEQIALKSTDVTGTIFSSLKRTGSVDSSCDWLLAALRLQNTVALNVQFTATSVEGLAVEVTIGSRTISITEFTDLGNNKYSFIFADILATEYDTAVSFKFISGQTQIGQTLTYSVASYIAEAIENAETSEKAVTLMRALYAYGVSAKVYAASIS